MPRLLVLYHSRTGSVKQLAEHIGEAAELAGLDVVYRVFEQTQPDDLVVSKADLIDCDALAFGTPTRFGMMAAVAKAFWETTSDIWLKGQLIDKPAAVFTSSTSMHGGNEMTLMSLATPLLHQGMMLLGVPYDVPELTSTESGGTPYGASHVAGMSHSTTLTNTECAIANALGKRLANITLKLNHDETH